MTSEFVGLSNPEVSYGKKHLLQGELELLNLIKSFRNYRELRKEEFVLKVTLKNKINETLTMLAELNRYLPKTHFKLEKEKKEDKEEKKKKLTLQQEIDEVRRKLAKLQTEM